MSQESKTQREQIDEIMQHVHAPGAGYIARLQRLLSITQNGPPDGERDSSITSNLWCLVRTVIDSSHRLGDALNDWEAAVEAERPPPESA